MKKHNVEFAIDMTVLAGLVAGIAAGPFLAMWLLVAALGNQPQFKTLGDCFEYIDHKDQACVMDSIRGWKAVPSNVR